MHEGEVLGMILDAFAVEIAHQEAQRDKMREMILKSLENLKENFEQCANCPTKDVFVGWQKELEDALYEESGRVEE